MTHTQKPLALWVIIVSGLFTVMEIGVGLSLFLYPESMADSIDLSARGVTLLTYMWATRQIALGGIFGYATYRRSVHMLTIAYLFFLIMFVGDLLSGILLNDMNLVMSAIVMTVISAVMMFVINRNK